MFKFWKKKLVPEIARIEDLQVGDMLQYSHGIIQEVSEVRKLDKSHWTFKNSPQFVITLKPADPKDLCRAYSYVLFGEQNVIVWK